MGTSKTPATNGQTTTLRWAQLPTNIQISNEYTPKNESNVYMQSCNPGANNPNTINQSVGPNNPIEPKETSLSASSSVSSDSNEPFSHNSNINETVNLYPEPVPMDILPPLHHLW